MAKAPTSPVTRLSTEAQKNLLSYVSGVLVAHKRFSEMRTKMEAIDIAYARYRATGEGGDTPCNALKLDEIVAPIVVSQVDSMVGYLADVFLSGYPIFPVVSTFSKKAIAEQLEALIDDHAILGGYSRQFLMMFRDGVKYNFSAIEVPWEAIDQFQVVADFAAAGGQTVSKADKYITKVKRLDPYNTLWDYTVNPGDVSTDGDYAGEISILSRTKLKRLLNKFTKERAIYNAKEALDSTLGTSIPATSQNYTVHPTVSNYITPRIPNMDIDWEAYLNGGTPGSSKRVRRGIEDNYEVVRLYARIIPSDFGIMTTEPNTPQIWKLVVVNSKILVHAKRIISAQDTLPILIGQPLEDGLGYQTKSIAEGEIPIQEAVTTLFGIRFNSARRAVSDRALYDPNLINPSDINAPVPAPKIPVKVNTLTGGGLDAAYKQIPFDARGTESTIQDAAILTDFSKQLSGISGPQQGQFQKGNKSVQEWNDTMGGSDNRLRLPALCYEHQVFIPLKQILLLNLFQFGEDAKVVSQKNGEEMDIKIDELRKTVLTFRVADGYTPKSKLASTDMLMQGMNLLMNSPILQQRYGAMLPNMFAHMMQLGGVRGLDEYSPESQAQGQAPTIPGVPIPAPLPTAPVAPETPPIPEGG